MVAYSPPHINSVLVMYEKLLNITIMGSGFVVYLVLLNVVCFLSLGVGLCIVNLCVVVCLPRPMEGNGVTPI